MAATPIIRTHALTKTFGSGRSAVHAVDDVSLEIDQGEIALVMGPSGSGKTTLLSMLGTLLRPTSGHIFLESTELTALPESRLPDLRARRIGFIFQAFNLLDALTVEENILLPARLAPGGIAAARERGRTLVGRLGLSNRARAYPGTLSGGEKQRVAIARALINQPPVILADEPTGNLDSKSGQEVLMILHDVARDEGCSVVLVTHDPRVEEVADRILWLADGKLRDRKEEVHDWARDPVCGMQVDAWTATFTARHAGVTHVFCSARCRERFLAEPQRYVEADAGNPIT